MNQPNNPYASPQETNQPHQTPWWKLALSTTLTTWMFLATSLQLTIYLTHDQTNYTELAWSIIYALGGIAQLWITLNIAKHNHHTQKPKTETSTEINY